MFNFNRYAKVKDNDTSLTGWLDGQEDHLYGKNNGLDNNNVNLSELFELFLNKKICSNFVRIITEDPTVQVKYGSVQSILSSGGVATISGDAKEIMIKPVNKENNLDVIVGIACHEASHLKYTDYNARLMHGVRNGLSKVDLNIVSQVENWIEDRRIDALTDLDCPGYSGYYNALYNRYFADWSTANRLHLKANEISVHNYMDNVICGILNPHYKVDTLPRFNEIIDLLDIPNISRLKSTTSSIDLAIDLLNKVKEIVISEKQPEPPKSESKSDESRDSESDSESDDSQSDSKEDSKEDSKGDSKEDSKEDSSDDGKDDSDESDGSNDGDEDGDDSESGDDASDESDGEDSNGTESKDSNGKESKPGSDPGSSSKQVPISDEELYGKNSSVNDEVRAFTNGKTLDLKDALNAEVSESLNSFEKCAPAMLGTKNKVMFISVGNQALNAIFSIGLSCVRNSPTLGAKEAYSKALILGKKLADRIKLQSESRELKSVKLKSGLIDKRNLAKASFQESIFYNTSLDTPSKKLIHLDIDASGSMSTFKFTSAVSTALAIAKACELIKNMSCEIWLRYDDTVSSHARLGTQANVIIEIYNSKKGHKLDGRRIQMMGQWFATSGTPEGACYAGADQAGLIKSSTPGEEVYFITMTDGSPNHGDIEITKTMAKKLKQRLTLRAYFVGNGSKQDPSYKDMEKLYGSDVSRAFDYNNSGHLGNEITDMLLKKR